MSHDHTFEDILEFGFEDVIVFEIVHCHEEFCDAEKPTQYEVDFNSFVQDGTDLSESEATSVWDDICDEYGTRVETYGERWQSDAVEIETRDGKRVTFYYDDSFDRMQKVQLTLNGNSVKFDVDFYRELGLQEK